MVKSNEVTLEDALSIAKKHHQRGNLTLADRTYRDILNIYPENFTSLHFLGIIAYQRGAIKEGVDFMHKAISVNDNNPESWNAYAVMLELTGQIEKALESWEKALDLKPEYPDALSNFGNALWKTQDYKKAQQMCEKALEIKPDFPPALLNLGNALLAQGENEKAIEYWEHSLKVVPDNYNAHINIGNALRDLGRIQESEEHCRKALEFSPDHPDALLNLANALSDQGQHEEAEKLLKKATDIKPDFVRAHSNLALVLMDLLRYDEALTASKYAIAFDPEFAEAYGNMAVILRELGKLEEAEEKARKAFELAPDSAEARIDLGEILFLLDKYEEAVTLFNEAMELKPDTPRLYIKLSAALDRANRPEEALEALEKAVELNPEMPEAYNLQGITYLTSNQTEKAHIALDKALEIKPDFAEAIATKSEVLQSEGKMEEAEKLIRSAIEINDQIPSLYMTLSKVKKFKKDDEDLKVMEELKGNADKFGKAHIPPLYYALFKAYEDIGEYDKAFEHLKFGADAKRSSVVYNAENQTSFLETLKHTSNKDYFDAYEGKGYEDDTPIFIVGMPRSGTTLTEQIISSHPDVYGAGELYTLGNVEQEIGTLSLENAKEWGKSYVDSVRAINEDSKKARKITDKMPGNYIRLGQIVNALPNAKIIHCRRNPIDTCLSCYKQLFGRGHYWSYNLEEMVRHYEEYDDIMSHWREIIPDRFMEVHYEDTVNDFENQARKLIDFVGMEWDDACLSPHKQKRAVLTASKGQVIKPIYKTSVEAWRRYETQLQPLAEKLEKYVRPSK